MNGFLVIRELSQVMLVKVRYKGLASEFSEFNVFESGRPERIDIFEART